MTKPRITLSERIGLSHIDCFPVWDKDGENAVLLDMYLRPGMVWMGSLSRLEYCKEVDRNLFKPEEPEVDKKTFPYTVYKVLINEITPRIKKNKLSYEDIPPAFASILCSLEFEGKITRKQLRQFLDDHIQWVKEGRPCNEEEKQRLINEYASKTKV